MLRPRPLAASRSVTALGGEGVGADAVDGVGRAARPARRAGRRTRPRAGRSLRSSRRCCRIAAVSQRASHHAGCSRSLTGVATAGGDEAVAAGQVLVVGGVGASPAPPGRPRAPAAPWASACSTTTQAAGAQQPRARCARWPRMASRPSVAAPQRPRPGRGRATSGGDVRAADRDVRRVADHQVDRAVEVARGPAEVASPCSSTRSTPCAGAAAFLRRCAGPGPGQRVSSTACTREPAAPPARGPARSRRSRCTGRRPAARRRPSRAAASMAQPATPRSRGGARTPRARPRARGSGSRRGR